MVEYLSKGQIDDLKKLFDEMDKDKDGKLTLDEIKDTCKALKIDVTEEQLSQIITLPKEKESSVTKSMVTFPDFLICMSRDNQDVDKLVEEVIMAFKVFDREGTGQLSITELKHILTTMGQKFTIEEVEEMFNAAGISDEISIDYTAFVYSMLSK